MRLLHCALAAALAAAALAPAKTLLLLPISGETDRTSDIAAINRLFRDAVGNRHGGPLAAAPTDLTCEERACALEAAGAANADAVIFSSFHKLGARWIFSATILNTDGTGAFNQRLTALSIEDMEAVTLRMADALILRKNLEQAATVDNVTQREAEREPERRRSLYHTGVALGYLFPIGNEIAYNGNRKSERFSWVNSWEFRDNLALSADLVWVVPHTLGADLSLRYYLDRSDFSPFVGGGVGLHGGDGLGSNATAPAINAQGGLILFRTYDVNVMLRGQYQMLFSDDIFHSAAVDIGISFRPKEERGKKDGLGFWGYTGITLVTLMILGLLAE